MFACLYSLLFSCLQCEFCFHSFKFLSRFVFLNVCFLPFSVSYSLFRSAGLSLQVHTLLPPSSPDSLPLLTSSSPSPLLSLLAASPSSSVPLCNASSPVPVSAVSLHALATKPDELSEICSRPMPVYGRKCALLCQRRQLVEPRQDLILFLFLSGYWRERTEGRGESMQEGREERKAGLE